MTCSPSPSRWPRAGLVLLLSGPLLASPVTGQHGGSHAGGPASKGRHAAPCYADLADRRLKALSAAQEAELREGRGIGLALAAELNGYPGPLHVLEHADALGLTPDQRTTAITLRTRMAAEAQATGLGMLALEEDLDRRFAGGTADPQSLAALDGLGGRLREAHLGAHIGMRAALTPAQRAAYARLRGYRPRDCAECPQPGAAVG